MSDIFESARSWIAGDPDHETASQLERMVEARDDTGVQQAMGGVLQFGTAGIRGVVGPGPNQMNRAVVIKTSKGLCDYLTDRHGNGKVVVGFDARPTSRTFAEDTVGVLAAGGLDVVYFPDYAPTPLVAFAAKDIGAIAAVVITASHNPPTDNGYKVYDANAAQIISPVDSAISEAISRVGVAKDVPRVTNAFSGRHDSIAPVGDDMIDRYWAEVESTRPTEPATTVKIAYTPLHGVGGATLTDIFARTVHRDLHVVPSQFEPDGTFPTVEFPNPEEPGALDLAMAFGAEIGADLILANDPDADRLAAAVPRGGAWRLFTGNELGCLLGAYVLDNWKQSAQPITANSIVSSPMLSMLSSQVGGVHLTTLTGFKWIINAALSVEQEERGRFAFGYEEALGYSVGRVVRDKDGISAALLLADLAATERESGRTLLDSLHDLWSRVGIWVSTQRSIVRDGVDGQAEILEAVDRLAADPPRAVGRFEVSGVMDYRSGESDRPFWLGAQPLVELTLGEAGRVLARPSGTEPKLKIYVDLTEGLSAEQDAEDQRDRLAANAGELAESIASLISAPNSR